LFLPTGGAGKAISLDNMALIAAIEHPNSAEAKAVMAAIKGKEVLVSVQAAKEFLVKGDSAALRGFLEQNGGRIAKSAPEAVVRGLKALGLKDGDARVVGSAIREGVRVLTNDKQMIKKVPGLVEKM
jgi:hypothetical protein